MIPVSEIERVIKQLELDLLIAEQRITEELTLVGVGYWHSTVDKCRQVISQLKELIPSEPNNSSE